MTTFESVYQILTQPYRTSQRLHVALHNLEIYSVVRHDQGRWTLSSDGRGIPEIQQIARVLTDLQVIAGCSILKNNDLVMWL